MNKTEQLVAYIDRIEAHVQWMMGRIRELEARPAPEPIFVELDLSPVESKLAALEGVFADFHAAVVEPAPVVVEAPPVEAVNPDRLPPVE